MLKKVALISALIITILQSALFGILVLINLNDQCTGTSTGCNHNTLACNSTITILEIIILILILIVFIAAIAIAYKLIISNKSVFIIIAITAFNLLSNVTLLFLSPIIVGLLLDVPTGPLSCLGG